MPVLSFQNVQKSFCTPNGPQPVLVDVSLKIEAGESVALVGESGSGKSTLLSLAAALDQSDHGDVMIGARSLSVMSEQDRALVRRQEISVIFQQFNLIHSLNVADNVAFQAKLAGRFDAREAQALMARLGLEGLEKRLPSELSGGQQQRVAIARAILAKPSLLLADEPTGNLDEANALEVVEVLQELVKETGAALLFVTHSLKLASLMDRKLVLKRGLL